MKPSPEFLYHATITTGHIRKTTPDEVKPEIYFRLHRVWREAQTPEGAEVMDGGYRAKATVDGGMALVTIWSPDGMPIITSGISPSGDPYVWKLLHEKYYGFKAATHPEYPPPGPYIADRVELGSLFHPQALQWTGDFCRCFGWVVAAPERIRPK